MARFCRAGGALFAAAVLVSLGVTLWYGFDVVRFGDAGDYLAAARSLLTTGTYPRTASLPFFRPPGYPLFIAGLWSIVPESVVSIKVAQAFLFATTCWLLFRMALLAASSRAAAIAGAGLYALNPFALRQAAEVQTETLHTTLVAGGVWLLLRGCSAGRNGPESFPRSAGWNLAAGLAFGAAALCRPTALFVGVALSGFCVFAPTPANMSDVRRRRLLRSARGIAFLLGMTIAILPWTCANWKAEREFILITDGGGYHLWLGNHPAQLRIYDGPFRTREEFDAYSYDTLQRALPDQQIAQWESEGGYSRLSLRARERKWRDAAIANLREHPALTARLWFEKAKAYWRPWLHPAAYPPIAVYTSGVALSALYVAAVAGASLWARRREGRIALSLFALLFVSSTLVHVMTHVMMRFRLPYVDPYLSLLAGTAAVAVVRGIRAESGEQKAES